MIIHLDLDCFFVSAERTRTPELRGVPAVAVNRNDTAIFSNEAKPKMAFGDYRGAFAGPCWYDKFGRSKDWREHFIENGKIRGIVVAASYEARSHEIKTGTPLGEALAKCPKLKVLPTDMPFYYGLSKELADFLQERIPVLEQFSIDEFFGDLSGWVEDNEVEGFIRDLQAEVYKKLQLPATIGASSTKAIAKLAAKSTKPFGTRVVKPGEIAGFIENKPIRALAGIGRQTAAHLERFGVKTLGEAVRAPSLLEAMGKNGRRILAELKGEGGAGVEIASPRKRIGISRTFDPLSDRAEVRRRSMVLARHLAFTITSLGLEPTHFQISIGYRYGGGNSLSLSSGRIFSEPLLRHLVREHFAALDIQPGYAVTYLGLNAGGFATRHTPQTFSLLDLEGDRKNRRLSDAAQHVRAKYGVDTLCWAAERMD